jgi:hypothetical protein
LVACKGHKSVNMVSSPRSVQLTEVRSLAPQQVLREQPFQVPPGPELVQQDTQPAVLAQVDWEDRVGDTPEGHMEGRMHTHCGDATRTRLKRRGHQVTE